MADNSTPMFDVLRSVRASALLTAFRAGLWTPPDRRALDDVILPYYARAPGLERVLFVGVQAYNAKNRMLFAGRSYATLDPQSAAAAFGGDTHFVAPLQELSRHVAPGSFDAVVINGVIGYGLDTVHELDRALAAVHRALREDGELVIGMNEQREPRVPLEKVEAMSHFTPCVFAPFGVQRRVLATPLRERTHTFLFFRRA